MRSDLRNRLEARKEFIVIEVLIVAAIPIVWSFLPIPQTILPVLLIAWISLWLRGNLLVLIVLIALN